MSGPYAQRRPSIDWAPISLAKPEVWEQVEVTISIIEEDEIRMTRSEYERMQYEYAQAMQYRAGPLPSFESWVRSHSHLLCRLRGGGGRVLSEDELRRGPRVPAPTVPAGNTAPERAETPEGTSGSVARAVI